MQSSANKTHQTHRRRVAIVGRGRLGTAVQQALTAAGTEVVLLSREDGFDISRPVSFDGLGHFDAVVEATDIFTRDRAVATGFFTASTQHINAAAIAAGIPKHVLVTIVNATDARLSGNGYYAGKAAQETAALQHGQNMVIVHSTLWFEFARQNIDRMRVGPFAIVPQMKVQPIALDVLATVVAECCIGTRPGSDYTVCGPQVKTLWAMTKQLPHKGCIPLSIPILGVAGRALRDGTLIPKSGTAEIAGPTFEEWLNSLPR